MDNSLTGSYTSFDGYRRIASGPLQVIALVVKQALERGTSGPVLIFDDATGRPIDIDTRGSDEEVITRLATSRTRGEPAELSQFEQVTQPASKHVDTETRSDEPRGRGRPKLGVVPREVTLLPRHWEWLATQTGGASVALRKLVEQARQANGDKDRIRKAQERAYHFISAIAGDLPGFEEATRALFANDRPKFSELIAAWPSDVRDHAIWLAFSHGERVSTPSR